MSKTSAQIVAHVSGTEQRLNKQDSELERVVLAEMVRASQLEAEQMQLREQIRGIQAAFAVAEQAPADPPAFNAFVDPSIVRVSTAQLMALEDITKTFKAWLDKQ
jgi:hypothetical protein